MKTNKTLVKTSIFCLRVIFLIFISHMHKALNKDSVSSKFTFVNKQSFLREMFFYRFNKIC